MVKAVRLPADDTGTRATFDAIRARPGQTATEIADSFGFQTCWTRAPIWTHLRDLRERGLVRHQGKPRRWYPADPPPPPAKPALPPKVPLRPIPLALCAPPTPGILAAIDAEPGEWTAAGLADDLDLDVAEAGALVERLVGIGRVVRDKAGFLSPGERVAPRPTQKPLPPPKSQPKAANPLTPGTLSARLFALIQERPGLRGRDLAERLGTERHRVGQVGCRLCDRRLITRSLVPEGGDWIYRPREVSRG